MSLSVFYYSYSLVVSNNANLKELFPEQVASNLLIKKGNVSFHYNHKLCYNKIEAFIKGLPANITYNDSDVSQGTNGDQIPCKITINPKNAERVK